MAAACAWAAASSFFLASMKEVGMPLCVCLGEVKGWGGIVSEDGRRTAAVCTPRRHITTARTGTGHTNANHHPASQLATIAPIG